MAVLYDKIGINYSDLRRPDPSIERAIAKGLGDGESVLNVGAGTGSYEPRDRRVVAIEISSTMIRQRKPGSAPVIQASAMQLPLKAKAVEASMAILTVHHWSDFKQGLQELRRVTRGRIVILTWDPLFAGFWLNDYLPEILHIDRVIFPRLEAFESALGATTVSELPVPHDCTDGFLCAYWRRPEAYLDKRVRAAISTFSKLGDISEPLRSLQNDIASGKWEQRNREVLHSYDMDLGYRLIVSHA